MKLRFIYDEEKDIDCLLAKGPSSINNSEPTKTYQQLVGCVSDIADREKVREFIWSVRGESIYSKPEILQEKWDKISDEYQKRAEGIFGVLIDDEINVYLTVTGRYPYSVEGKYFFVSAYTDNANATCMHELWHFYTWKCFSGEQSKILSTKFNDLKEALTILLNIECADLLEGVLDQGYSQHQKLRQEISEIWSQTKDIKILWNKFSQV